LLIVSWKVYEVKTNFSIFKKNIQLHQAINRNWCATVEIRHWPWLNFDAKRRILLPTKTWSCHSTSPSTIRSCMAEVNKNHYHLELTLIATSVLAAIN